MKRSKGELSKASRKLVRKRKLTPMDFIREFVIGDKVAIDPSPYYAIGKIPHMRYRGRVGSVIEKRGRSYVIEFHDGNKTKRLAALPVFLRKVA